MSRSDLGDHVVLAVEGFFAHHQFPVVAGYLDDGHWSETAVVVLLQNLEILFDFALSVEIWGEGRVGVSLRIRRSTHQLICDR